MCKKINVYIKTQFMPFYFGPIYSSDIPFPLYTEIAEISQYENKFKASDSKMHVTRPKTKLKGH